MTSGPPRRVVFFGSPGSAVTVVDALVGAGHVVVGVVTQPARRRGRGGSMSVTPVHHWAAQRGTPVVHAPLDARQWCEEASLGVVVAYGRLVPASLLSLCPMVNVHFSLLPRWRGAAPVERAILAGDEETGVSIMELEATLDTGAVFSMRSTPINDLDTTTSLTERLARMGAEEMLKCLSGELPTKTPQRGEPTYAAKIEPAERLIDWSRESVFVDRQVRALDAWCWVGSRRLGVRTCVDPRPTKDTVDPVGTVHGDGSVVTGDGTLTLVKVRPEGRREMTFSEWWSGLRAEEPVVLRASEWVP